MILLLGNKKVEVIEIWGESDDIQIHAVDYETGEDLTDKEHEAISQIYAAELYEEWLDNQIFKRYKRGQINA